MAKSPFSGSPTIPIFHGGSLPRSDVLFDRYDSGPQPTICAASRIAYTPPGHDGRTRTNTASPDRPGGSSHAVPDLRLAVHGLLRRGWHPSRTTRRRLDPGGLAATAALLRRTRLLRQSRSSLGSHGRPSWEHLDPL